VIVEEGKVRILAPNVNLKGPGKIEGVFYNRAMVFNRDTTIFLLHNLKVKNALDALAATGVRGIRIVKELEIKTTINDRDARAVEIIKENLELNDVEARVTNRDARALMNEEKYDYVDIDPFGTPVPFIDSALLSGKIIGITATDTATLGGRNRRIVRRYLADVKTPPHFVHEIGIRVLIGYIGRMATRFDLGIEPIISIWHGHFFRVYVRVKRGVSKANATLDNIKNTEFGGPMWIGELHDSSFLKNAKIPQWLPTKRTLENYIDLWKNEKFFLFYHIPSIASELKVSTPSPKKIMKILKELGYEAYPTQFSPQGVRTNATEDVLRDVIKSANVYHWESQ